MKVGPNNARHVVCVGMGILCVSCKEHEYGPADISKQIVVYKDMSSIVVLIRL